MSVDVLAQLLDIDVVRNKIRPMLAAFLNHGDTTGVRALLLEATEAARNQGVFPPEITEYYREQSEKLLRGDLPRETLDESSGVVLLDPPRIREYQAKRTLNRFLVLQLGAVFGGRRKTTFQLSRGELADYLRERCSWLEETLSMSNDVLWSAPRLDPGIGCDAWVLDPSAASRLLAAVRSVPLARGGIVRQEQEDFLKALEMASQPQSRHLLLIRML